MPPLIAVANDDTDFLGLMGDLLTDEGYRVSIHRVAKDAYEELKEALPDLIILDIHMEMPEAGWMLLELLTLHPDLSTIPVIVCSADVVALRAKVENLRAHGCDALEKPFDLDDLLEKVRLGLIGREAAAQQSGD
jgi:DNA-binding response OmpR family regulator